MLSGLWWPYIDCVCGSIHIPKSLKIRNVRLGILFRVLQLVVVIVLILQILHASAWTTVTKPVAYGMEMWAERGPREAMLNHNTKPCSDPAFYHYTYSREFSYNASRCKVLGEEESYVQNGLNIFFPTYFWKDTIVTEKPAEECATLTCGPGDVRVDDGAFCQCKRNSEYLAMNPEEYVLYINHGFAVNELDPLGRKSRISSRSTMESKDFDILTVITRNEDKDTKCAVGGRHSWPLDEARGGIHGSLKEWIACGGLSLDDVAESSTSGLPSEVGVPRVRLSGLSLQISLLYTDQHKEKHNGPVCYMHVRALPLWNSLTTMDYVRLPTGSDNTTSYRSRRCMGITVSITASGAFHWFDFGALVVVFSSAVVLLSVPSTVVQYVARTCVGRLSRIYDTVAIEDFNIIDRFHGVCSRLLTYKTCFDSLSYHRGGKLTIHTLSEHLQEIFQAEKDAGPEPAGPVDRTEIEKMVNFILCPLDPSGDGKVSLRDFLAAASADPVKIGDLAIFFDKSRKRSCLEKLLGGVIERIEMKAEKQKKEQGHGVWSPTASARATLRNCQNLGKQAWVTETKIHPFEDRKPAAVYDLEYID